jgi:RHS repeat-associated protein
VRQVADDSGIIVLARDYGPYGRVIGEYGTGSSGYGYAGEQTDAYTQFIFLRARWLDPKSGRFVSQDTWTGSIHQPGTLHKYLYVLANPLGYVDPSGYSGCPVGTPCYDPGSGLGNSTPLPGDRDLTNWLYRELKAAIRTPEVQTLRIFASSGNLAMQAMALEGWASLVRDRHRWDFKHRIRSELQSEVIVFHTTDGTPFAAEYSVPGNIFYGYVGHSIFSGEALHLGAGWAEFTDPAHCGEKHCHCFVNKKGEYRSFYLNWQWTGSLFDDLEDYRVVEFGVQLWNKYRHSLTEGQFVQEIENHRFQFPLVPPAPYGTSPFGWHNSEGKWPYPEGHFNGYKPSWFDRFGLFQE